MWDINAWGTKQREKEAPEQGHGVQQELNRHEKKGKIVFFKIRVKRWLCIDKRGHETGQGEKQGSEAGGTLPVPAQGDSLLIGPVWH